MHENTEKLTPSQQKAIAMIVDGKRHGDIAKSMAISPSTLYRWRQTAVFKAALAQQRQVVRDAYTTRILALNDKAIDVLEALLTDTSAKPEVRLSAAKDILDRTYDMEVSDQADRIAALEARALAEQSKWQPLPLQQTESA